MYDMTTQEIGGVWFTGKKGANWLKKSGCQGCFEFQVTFIPIGVSSKLSLDWKKKIIVSSYKALLPVLRFSQKGHTRRHNLTPKYQNTRWTMNWHVPIKGIRSDPDRNFIIILLYNFILNSHVGLIIKGSSWNYKNVTYLFIRCPLRSKWMSLLVWQIWRTRIK